MIFNNVETFSLMKFPVRVIVSALGFPVSLPLVLLHRIANVPLPPSLLIFGTLLFWLFPIARLRRWIGTYDSSKGADTTRPRLLGWAAHLLDANDKRKFGTTKTGGWA